MTSLTQYYEAFDRYVSNNVATNLSDHEEELMDLVRKDQSNEKQKQEIKSVFDQLSRAWKKKYSITKSLDKDEEKYNQGGFWPYFLRCVEELKEASNRGKNSTLLEDKVRNLETVIKNLESSRLMLNRIPNKATYFQYYIYKHPNAYPQTIINSTDIINNEDITLDKLNFLQVLDMNVNILKDQLVNVQSVLSKDKLIFKNKSKKLDTKLAAAHCANYFHSNYGEYMYSTTAKLVNLVLDEQIDKDFVTNSIKLLKSKV